MFVLRLLVGREGGIVPLECCVEVVDWERVWHCLVIISIILFELSVELFHHYPLNCNIFFLLLLIVNIVAFG